MSATFPFLSSKPASETAGVRAEAVDDHKTADDDKVTNDHDHESEDEEEEQEQDSNHDVARGVKRLRRRKGRRSHKNDMIRYFAYIPSFFSSFPHCLSCRLLTPSPTTLTGSRLCLFLAVDDCRPSECYSGHCSSHYASVSSSTSFPTQPCGRSSFRTSSGSFLSTKLPKLAAGGCPGCAGSASGATLPNTFPSL